MNTKSRLYLPLLAALVLFTSAPIAAHSAEFPAQGRLFFGATKSEPKGLNTELSNSGFKSVDLVNRFGVEILFPVVHVLDVGLRYTKTHHTIDESSQTPGQSYNALIDQDSVIGVARVSVLKTSLLRADAFVGAGGSNTSFKFKNATLDGELSKREASDWFASIRTMYGVSAAIGHKNFYFVVEMGMDHNSINSLKSSGSLNAGLTSNVQSVDLSGPYVTIGLLFDGITASSR